MRYLILFASVLSLVQYSWASDPVPTGRKAYCDLLTTKGDFIGRVMIEEVKIDGVTAISMFSEISNVQLPDGPKGFHIHQFGKTSDGCKDAGPHFNPAALQHGSPLEHTNRHLGDLGNIYLTQKTAKLNILDSRLKLEESKDGIINRSIVLHEQEDDLGRGFKEDSKTTVKCEDVSEIEINNIGNHVAQSFDEEGFKQPGVSLLDTSPVANPVLSPLPRIPISNLHSRSHRPTLSQIQFLIQNKNNPAPQVFRRAKVIMTGLSGVNGLINLKQNKSGPVLIFGTLQGFPRQGKFGFHFHELPAQGGDCESAGEHFNPHQNSHGGKDSFVKHAGDLGNVVSQYNGVAHIVLTVDSITLGNGPNSVLGRTLVVHVNEDDLGTRPSRESAKTGNSGSRLACGVVTLVSPILAADNNLN